MFEENVSSYSFEDLEEPVVAKYHNEILIRKSYNVFIIDDPLINIGAVDEEPKYNLHSKFNISVRHKNPVVALIYFDGLGMYTYTANSGNEDPIERLTGVSNLIMNNSVNEKKFIYNGSVFRLFDPVQGCNNCTFIKYESDTDGE